MPEERLRVLVVASHPLRHAVPVFRSLVQHAQLDFQVAHCLRGAEAGHRPEFSATVPWDVLLDGCASSPIANRRTGAESFFGLCNPELWSFAPNGKFDVVSIGSRRATVEFFRAVSAHRKRRTLTPPRESAVGAWSPASRELHE